MNHGETGKITRILEAGAHGDRGVTEKLLPLVYEDLRELAAYRMAQERPGQTLQATALVHEAYLRLLGDDSPDWGSRGHFFAAAAEAMRRILVERARRKGRLKHGGGRRRIDVEDPLAEGIEEKAKLDFVSLDKALHRMEEEDPRMAEVVKLRFFAGLSIEDTARAMDLSAATVKRDWVCARAWLYDEVQGDDE